MASTAAARKPDPKPVQLAPALRAKMGKKSQREYARELGIAVSRLNEVLRRKRTGFSARNAVSVSSKTGIDLQLCLGVR